MAQNDWYFSYSYQSGDTQGIAIFHNSLSNPLTNEEHGVGTYCRRFSYYNSYNGGDPGFSLHTKNSNFVNVPDTKAISVRAWLRLDQHGGRTGYYGITVKSTSTSWAPSGYFFRLQNDNVAYLDGTTISRPAGVSFEHTWNHMRLDVIPIKHNGVVIMDHLKAYFEVDGEWVLAGEKYKESTDSGFISWSGSRYNGLRTYYDQRLEGGTHHLYVDKVEMYLEDVEQPERPVISLQNDTGPSDQDNITSDPTVVVSQPEVGATLSYSTDAVNWQSTVPAAVSGSNTLYVRQISAEGRTSPPGQLTFTYVPAGAAPTFTSLTASSVVENGGENQVVYTAAATSDLTDVIYSLKEVGDYQDFSIGLNNGQVTTLANLDYETKNAYSFTTIATDLAGHAVEQDVSLSVTDANEDPSFVLTLALGTEGSPLSEDAALDTVVGALSFTDSEGDSVSFSIDTQTVAGTFAISGSSLVLTSSLDYEVASEHTVQISANDGVNTVNQSYVVKIGDVNEAPTFSLSLSSDPVSEDAAIGTVVGTLSGTDPENDSLTFSIVSQSPAGSFEISGSDLKVASSLDYETNTSHSLTLRASDGTNDVDQSVSISIGDVDDIAPVLLSSSPADGATNVAVDADVVLTFDKAVYAGAGNIHLMTDYSEGHASVEQFSASDSRVTFSGDNKTVTINFASDLASDTAYHLDIGSNSDVFVDAAGNGYSRAHADYNFTTVAASDPDFSDVSLLLKMDGSNGSTTFTDDSSNSLTITVNGDAQISTTENKYGGASGYFDGTGDYLQVPYDDSLNLASGSTDWTVETWIRMPSIPSDAMSIIGASNGGGSNPKWMIAANMGTDFLYSANKIGFVVDNGGNQWINASHTWQVDTWYHVAVVHNSGTTTMYVDGTSVGSYSYNAPSVSSGIRVGSDGEGYRYFAGYMDDVRITKGTARYTSNFTPPGSHLTS